MSSIHSFPANCNTSLLGQEFSAAGFDVTFSFGPSDELIIEGPHTQTEGDDILAAHAGGASTETQEALDIQELLAEAIPGLRQWARDADAATVTSANAIPTLQIVLDRLSIFFDRFADLLELQNHQDNLPR